jgi:hypothetical protein
LRTRAGLTSPSHASLGAGSGACEVGSVERGASASGEAMIDASARFGSFSPPLSGVDAARHEQARHAARRCVDDEFRACTRRYPDVIDPGDGWGSFCRGTRNAVDATMPSGCGVRSNNTARFK